MKTLVAYQGEYNPATTYAVSDVVLFTDNLTYISLLANNLANAPNANPTYWKTFIGPSGTIDVGSVVPGAVASITNVGTAEAAILDFVLPVDTEGAGNASNLVVGRVPPARTQPAFGSTCRYIGNSITGGTGATSTATSWQAIVNAIICNGLIDNRAVAGTVISDYIGAMILRQFSSSQALTPFLLTDFNNGINFLGGAENDCNQTTSANANQILAYKQQHMAAIILLGTQQSKWISGGIPARVTATGTTSRWSYFTAVPPGKLMLTAGATLTFTIKSNGSPVYIVYPIFAGDTGNMTATLDGTTLLTDSITNSSNLANAPANGALLYSSSGWTLTLAAARFAGIAAGTHTITLTCTAPGTNGCGMLFATNVPSLNSDYSQPTVAVQGCLYQLNDAISATTAAYNSAALADAVTLQADGLNVIPIDIRSFLTLPNLSYMSGSPTFTSDAEIFTDLVLNGTNQVTSVTGFGASYTGKKILIVNGLTSSTPFYATVTGAGASQPNTLTLSVAVGVSGSGYTAYLGQLGQVTPASTSPDQHPNDAGHAAIARAFLSCLQAVTTVPIIPSPFVIPGVFTANVAANGVSHHDLNSTNHSPSTGFGLAGVPFTFTWNSGSAGSTGLGTMYGYDTVKTTAFHGIYTQFSTQTRIGQQTTNGAAGTAPYSAFTWGWAFDQGAAGGNGILFRKGLDSYQLGPQITAAATITPTYRFHHLTGTTAITTITVPSGSASLGAASGSPALVGFIGDITFIADAACVFATGGNIATALVCTAGQKYTATYDGTSWYIK